MHNLIAEKTEFKTWTDVEGNIHSIKSLDDIPLDAFNEPIEDKSSYIDIRDENVRMYSDPYSSSNYRNEYRQYTSEDPSNEGSIVLKAPSKLSWPTLASIVAVAANLLIAISAFYFNQSGFNDNVREKLTNLEAQQEQLKESVYSKREEDLRYDNIKLELAKQDEAIKRLQN